MCVVASDAGGMLQRIYETVHEHAQPAWCWRTITFSAPTLAGYTQHYRLAVYTAA